LALSSAAHAAEWKLNKDTSRVSFTATQQGSEFTGRFAAFDADITFDPGAPESGRIVGTVETASVNSRDSDRDVTMLDRDWFDVMSYPESRFESERIEAVDDGTYRAHGQLTLKGRTKPMVLDFTFDTADDSSAHLSGTMHINRFDFAVGEGWNDTSYIGEDVVVQVELDLSR